MRTSKLRCVAHGRMLRRSRFASAAAQEGIPVEWTTGPGQMEQLARDAIELGCERLLVAGGDGSLMEAAQALRNTSTAMAVIPGGTGNDFARTLGISQDPIQALRVAIDGEVKKSDVGVVTSQINGRAQQRIFINIAEVGFGADVVRRMNRYARYAGKRMAYPLSILSGLLTYKPCVVDLIVDGDPMHIPQLTNLVIANARYFGRGMMPAPDAEIDDGLFDVLLIQGMKRLEIARRFPELKNGPPPNDPHMQTFRCRSLTVEGLTGIEADGEILGCSPASFEIQDRSLSVVVGNQTA